MSRLIARVSPRFSTIVIVVTCVFLCSAPLSAFASATDGTINSSYRYAWSENAGWIDFGSSAGNVHVTDIALTGSAYGDNIGWITLNPPSLGGVTNNAEGTLSGYAWSENAGWIDFSKVTIGSDGIFAGNAWSENIGWITFGTDNNKVSTDWRPSSSRTTTSPSTSSSYGQNDQCAYGFNSQMNQCITTPAPSALSYDIDQGLPNPLPDTVSSTSTTHGSGLSGTQISAILSLLSSFGAEASVIANVRASLVGTENGTSSVVATNPANFSRDLKIGVTGADVKQLQQFLNTHGFAIANTGAGSPGSETSKFGSATQKALIKFQTANGITPAIGYFGPKTRDYIRNLTP